MPQVQAQQVPLAKEDPLVQLVCKVLLGHKEILVRQVLLVLLLVLWVRQVQQGLRVLQVLLVLLLRLQVQQVLQVQRLLLQVRQVRLVIQDPLDLQVRLEPLLR